MRRDQKGNAMIIVLCVLSVVIILGLSMAAISGSSRSATVKNQHNQQAYYTARSVLDSVVLMLQTEGNPENIAKGLHDKTEDGAVLTAKGDLEGMGSYTVTMTLTDEVEYITVLEPIMNDEGKQETDEKGKLLYREKEVVSRLPLKITVQSQYKDSAAMVSAYIDGTPVLGDAPAGGTDIDPEKPDKVPGGVDPVIQGLFEYVIGMTGTIGNMNKVTINGDIYADGAAGNLIDCQINDNIYAASLAMQGSTVEKGVYTKGGFARFDNVINGPVVDNKPLPVPPPGTLGAWKPPVAPSKLDAMVDATKGPVYLTTDATEISHLQIVGDYPVYIQVTGSSLRIDTKGYIIGARNTQVFYLCADSVSKVTIGPENGNAEGEFDGYIYAPSATITVNKNITVNGALSGNSLTVTGDGRPDNITLNYHPPVGKHPDDIFPLPDDGDDGSGGGSGGGDGDDGGKDDPLKPDEKPDDPDDTKDKIVEKYQWPITGYQGGAA